MKNPTSQQLAEALLAAAQKAAPDLVVRAASCQSAQGACPLFFIHASAADGTEVCGHGETLEWAAVAVREKIKQAVSPLDDGTCGP